MLAKTTKYIVESNWEIKKLHTGFIMLTMHNAQPFLGQACIIDRDYKLLLEIDDQ